MHIMGIFAMCDGKWNKMARTRALLTQTDRDQIANDVNENENKRYQAISRVRSRIQDELPQDVEVLRKHHPGLFEELRNVVCENCKD